MTNEEPDGCLVSKAKAGDMVAFETLVNRYRARLLRQIHARLGNRVRTQLEAEDVVQETTARALRAIQNFRWQGEESFYRWLASIAEHLIWNESQKRSSDQIQLSKNVPAGDRPPSKELRRHERFDRLQQAVNQLSPDYRTALTMARFEGLKVHEIAVKMNRSPKAVYALITRALEQVKATFGDTESLHLPDRTIQVPETQGDD